MTPLTTWRHVPAASNSKSLVRHQMDTAFGPMPDALSVAPPGSLPRGAPGGAMSGLGARTRCSDSVLGPGARTSVPGGARVITYVSLRERQPRTASRPAGPRQGWLPRGDRLAVAHVKCMRVTGVADFAQGRLHCPSHRVKGCKVLEWELQCRRIPDRNVTAGQSRRRKRSDNQCVHRKA